MPIETLPDRDEPMRPDGGVSVTVNELPPDISAEEQDRERVRKLLAEARGRFRESSEAERQLRADMMEDLRFRAGEQWPDSVKQSREADNRPCLTTAGAP